MLILSLARWFDKVWCGRLLELACFTCISVRAIMALMNARTKPDAALPLRIALLRKGSACVLFNGKDYRLGQALPTERGLRADLDGRPVGYVIWAVHEAGAGPQPWQTKRHAFLYSAWVEPQLRGQGVFTALMQELRNRLKDCAIYTLTADPVVEHLTDRS